MKRLWAPLRQRCPVCLKGHVFKSLFGMHADCPVCGIHFERETGFFLNSMFIAYTLGFLILIPTAVLLYLWDASILVFTVVIVVETVVIWPVLFRYSRLIWMHADQVLDPRQPPAADAATSAAPQP